MVETSKRKFRIKIGGNKNIKFTEGWVEFKDKKVARMVALSLNNTKMSLKFIIIFIKKVKKRIIFMERTFGALSICLSLNGKI